jgi:hypothetical protein
MYKPFYDIMLTWLETWVNFMTFFFKRFDKHSDLILDNNDIIRVYLPNDDGGVYAEDFVEVAINRTDLPIGFLRVGFDYFLIDEKKMLYKHYSLGLRSKNKMKEWLNFNESIDFKKVHKEGWSLAIIP